MTPLPDAAVGAVVAALIAGTLAFAGLIISKENKTSEFRQAWIDALRLGSAELIARAIVLDGVLETRFAKGTAWSEVREDAAAFIKALSEIRMRLNADEPPSIAVLKILNDIERLLPIGDDPSESKTAPARGAVFKQTKLLSVAVNGVLSSEWKRVKKGEPRYIISLIGAGIILLSGPIFLIVNSYTQKTDNLTRRVVEKPLSKVAHDRPGSSLPVDPSALPHSGVHHKPVIDGPVIVDKNL